MKSYRVSFFLVNREEDKAGNVTKDYEYLGSITVDDYGNMPIAAKAYRIAPAGLTRGDKLIIEEI